MEMMIHENGRTYRSSDEGFDFLRWYVFFKDAFEKFSTEQIKTIEQYGGYIELSLNGHDHLTKLKYHIRNMPAELSGELQALLDR